MNRRFSLYLDGVRIGAAFVVLLSHWAYPRFTDGVFIAIRDYNLGSDAVIVFFVLSGLVIAFLLEERDRTPGVYAFNRLTRIYSVALPAVVLTMLFDTLGQRLDPAAYDGWWYNAAPVPELVASALTFTGEWGWTSFRLGTNGPYWSVTYEVWYYLLFGLVVFSRRSVVVLPAMVLAVVAAPKVMLLMPVWLAGVVTWRLISRQPSPPTALAWSLVIVPPVAYILALFSGIPPAMLALTDSLLGSETVTALRFSNEFAWNTLIGLLVSLHFIGVAAVVRRAALPSVLWERPVRWLAGGTFSLYLVHYPALQLFHAALPGMTPALRYALLLALVIGTAYLFAEAFERRLGAERAFLRRVGSIAAAWVPVPRRASKSPRSDHEADGPSPLTAMPR